ncbi:hypothetical protein ONE63_002749 [Megalurothrips usitatus]|uniref:Sodium channel protein Nach-like n=1 Tax=Megalurothrips usitatus TaxID=439358 RepID=A0AAV7X560_9NEOP|nr:hypothetical protein ONE63_002749 [Megalurothrips usitatus]
MFTQCAYKRSLAEETRDCCELLFPVFTEHGLCFAFNLNHSLPDWPGGSMRPKVFKQSFIEETDSRWSFSFDTDDAANNSVAVYISSSNDLPGMDQNPQHIWNKRVSKLMFVPKMTYTVAGARQLSVRQRGCVFPDEVKLRVSHVYSYTACQRQCRMDRIVRLCGCLPAFYTLLRGQRYCHLRELKCVVDNLEKLSPTTLRCDCPLGCEHTVYDMEKPHEAGGDRDEGSEELPGVEVGFLSWPLTRFKRDVLFGQVDLLVAIGTIGGLFLGLSLLSGVEIVYLFTLRAWCMLHTDRAHLEELAEEYARKEKQPVDLSLRPAFLKAQEAGGVVAVTPAGQRGPPVWKRDPVLARISKKMKGRGGDVYPYLH